MSKLEWEVLSVKNEYYIPKERKKELQWFCKQYNYWDERIRTINFLKRAVYGHTKVADNKLQDFTPEIAMELETYKTKKSLVINALKETTEDFTLRKALEVCIIGGYGREKVCAEYNLSEYEFRKAYNEFFWRLDKIRG